MKKLVLILICTLILTVFIAFNYLLWDREDKIKSIESLNSSSSVKIEDLQKKIETLDYINKQLREDISDLDDQNTRLRSEKKQAEEASQAIKGELEQKNEVINKLKQEMDTASLEAIVKKWVENIDSTKYEAAYELQINQVEDSKFELFDFISSYKNSIKSMKLKSIKLDNEAGSNQNRGGITFKVVLDVEKLENSSETIFISGLNQVFFKMTYEPLKERWAIWEVSSTR
ncbi:MAG: hypothetical protein N3B21_17370 [Clostridia bacterium]|nr:hypothetical protein [Clostridia bacterium]